MDSSFKRSLQVYGTICINGRGEVLLVHGSKSKKWSFPKGHYEKKDDSPIECARRELFEETGVVAPEKYLSYHRLQAGSYYLFVIDDEPIITIQDNNEIDNVCWWPLSNLPKSGCNVDVSMFRSLMKSFQKHESHKDFLSSRFAETRLASIKQNINRGTIIST